MKSMYGLHYLIFWVDKKNRGQEKSSKEKPLIYSKTLNHKLIQILLISFRKLPLALVIIGSSSYIK